MTEPICEASVAGKDGEREGLYLRQVGEFYSWVDEAGLWTYASGVTKQEAVTNLAVVCCGSGWALRFGDASLREEAQQWRA